MRRRHAVYAVHAVRPEMICSTEVIWTLQDDAETYAHDLSTDPGVLAGAVTEFVLNTPGDRHPTALYVNGQRQEVPHLSDDRKIAANGYIQHPTQRRNRRL
ncbi:hypothetical protein [Pseudonocardia acaciae]|uniref:hypothetical protein n=1 Tax=Pseudonocardia acaciae TaxID=551276 RepID=UPI0012EE11C0|nr:hypothetical protein [Pseudonocardia acaciae]